MLGRRGRSSVGMFIYREAGFRGESKYEPSSLPLSLCTLGFDEKDGPVGPEPLRAVTASEAVGPALGMGAGGSTLRILWVCGERVGYSARPPVGSRETQPSHMTPRASPNRPQRGAKGRQVFMTRHSWPLGGPLACPSGIQAQWSRRGVLGLLPLLHAAHHTPLEGPASRAVTAVSGPHRCHLRAPM